MLLQEMRVWFSETYRSGRQHGCHGRQSIFYIFIPGHWRNFNCNYGEAPLFMNDRLNAFLTIWSSMGPI